MMMMDIFIALTIHAIVACSVHTGLPIPMQEGDRNPIQNK